MLASALLGEDPPTLPVHRLVRLAGVLGINGNQARVALSRMVARGEVAADGEGTYTLAGGLLERSARLQQSRRGAADLADDRWHLVVVVAAGEPASARLARRRSLRAARLGELREGVWVRPANLEVALDAAVLAASTHFLSVPDDPVALAAASFDLAGWSRRSAQLADAMRVADLDAPGGLAAGFVLDADVLRHLQRDPLLPAPLLPAAWPGARLRALYDEFDAAFRARLAAVHHQHSSRGH